MAMQKRSGMQRLLEPLTMRPARDDLLRDPLDHLEHMGFPGRAKRAHQNRNRRTLSRPQPDDLRADVAQPVKQRFRNLPRSMPSEPTRSLKDSGGSRAAGTEFVTPKLPLSRRSSTCEVGELGSRSLQPSSIASVVAVTVAGSATSVTPET